MGNGFSRFDDTVAVITGGASGIGRALAVELWRRGSSLALIDIDEEGLRKFRSELVSSESDRKISLHIADVGDRTQMEGVCSDVIKAHGTLNLLINNAGIAYEAAFPQTSLETWERVIAVNLWGTIYGCHFFMPYLAKAKKAHIVNISSLFGIVGMPGQTAYCATKFAIRGFSECLWEELRDTTIGMTVVHPGSVATNIMKTCEGDDPGLLKRIDDWYEKHAMAAESTAATIVAAVEKGKPRVVLPSDAKFADFLKRLMPVKGNEAITNLVIRVLGLEDMREKRRLQWQKTMVDGDPWE